MIAASIVIGLALLALGGELIVRGGVGAAQRLDVSPMVIGVVLLGFGTSAPELVTSLQAALSGAPGIALGNVVGSNIANILLIAGIAAVIAGGANSMSLTPRDMITLVGATAVFSFALWADILVPALGVVFVAGLLLFLWLSMRGGSPELEEEEDGQSGSLVACLVMFAIGLAATLGGANLLVDGAVTLAEEFGLSEALIGVTIIAIGTSLPELAATVAAALRGRPEMALGNVVGSNIFNILGVAGVTMMVTPLPAPPDLRGPDMWVMVAATALLLVMARTQYRLSRGEGIILLIGYAAFIAVAAVSAVTIASETAMAFG